MTCIEAIPVEILELVGLHLSAIDYQRLRLSSSHIQLPFLQTQNFWQFYRDFRLYPKYGSVVRLNLVCLTERIFVWILRNRITTELRRILRSNFCSPSLQKLAFRQLVPLEFDSQLDDGIADILSELFDLGNIEPHSSLIGVFAMVGDTRHVLELLENRDLDPSFDNNFAIRFASQNGHTAIVEALLRHPKVDPAACSNHSIQRAAHGGHLTVVQLLSQHPRINRFALNDALQQAASCGNKKIVEYLLQLPQVDPTWESNHALRWAARDGLHEIVALLLQDGRSDPTSDDNFALEWSCKENHTRVVKLLLEDSRVDPCFPEFEAFLVACENGNRDIIELFLQHPRVRPERIVTRGINHVVKSTILPIALRKRYTKSSKFLLEYLNELPDPGFNSALQYCSLAVDSSLTASDEALDSTSPIFTDPKIQDILNQIPKGYPSNFYDLVRSCVDGHLELVQLYLQDPHIDPSLGSNVCIRLACLLGNSKIVEMLLQHPLVDPSDQANQAIYLAAKEGHETVIQLLLMNKRVDPHANNQVAIRKAVANQHYTIAKRLLSHKKLQ
jgi:ankyrin repeat protein